MKSRLGEVLSRRDEMIDELVHLAGGESTSAVTSIQVDMFECGFSAASFITSWARADN